MSPILPTPWTVFPRVANEGEVVRPAQAPARSHGGSLSARSSPGSPVNGRAITRPTACLPVRISRATRQPVVELLERDRLLVGGDLEDGVGGRVDDPLARLLVLLAELVDDVRAGRGLVPEHAARRPVHERVDHVVREPVRVGRHRGRGDDAHQLPVPRGRVLPLRALDEAARDRRRARLGRAALERERVAEPERLERGQVEASDGAGDVADRVRPLVSVLGRVRQLPCTDGVEHDHARTRHAGSLRRDGHRPRPHPARRLHGRRSSASRRP